MCSFNGLPGAEKLRLSRDGSGDAREEIVIVYQDGTVEKTLSRVSVTDLQWGSAEATVSLSMDVICGDETRYYCDVDGVETITFINVFRKFTATTGLPAKSDSDVMFCLQSYQGLVIKKSLVY